MTGIHRHIKASLALMLLTGLSAGCATYHTEQVVPEVIPAQVCGGDADTDGDGVTECNDRCPGSTRDQVIGPDGCPVPVLEPKPFRG